MAFHSLFLDSFDHYGTAQLGWKWRAVDPSALINSSPGAARTGTGCLELVQDAISGAVITPPLGNQPNLVVGFGFFPGLPATPTVMNFLDQAGNDIQCFVTANSDGSLAVRNHYIGQPGPTLLTTAPGLIRQGVYNYIELAIIFATAGQVYARINSGLIYVATNVNTIHSGNFWCDAVEPSGPPADADSHSLFDDFYVGFSDDPGNITADLQGARRIYPYIPSANETPLQWTPLANTNWQETSQIPPPGDSAYVESSAVGTTDQYQLAPVAGEGPPSGNWMAFGQTVISARLLNAGGASVAPDIAGNVGAGQALTTSYSMYLETYDVNPATSEPFTAADFASVFFGPQQTS